MIKSLIGAAIGFFATVLASQAMAVIQVDVPFSASGNYGFQAAGTFTVEGTRIVSITGETDGSPIVGLSLFDYADDQLPVDLDGIAWTTADGTSYSIYNNYPGYVGISTALPGVAITVSHFAPGVPEPATWALMLIGVGGIGGMLRHRRRIGRQDTPGLATTIA